MKSNGLLICVALVSANAHAQELVAKHLERDLSQPDPLALYWSDAPTVSVSLMAQPMVVPRPKETLTSAVRVQVLHDGTWLAVRMRWRDVGRDEAGRLGLYSDAAAVEFPVRAEGPPPPVMMGAKGDPVHMFHWRAQYQRDKEKGKPTMRDLYPNMTVDAYPLEYADQGSLRAPAEGAREQYSPGVAVGNPQSYVKTGVDEVVAEGFSTSSVQEGHGSAGEAVWLNDEWVLVISRRLAIEGGSTITPGRKTFVGFAVWQGGAGEVGSRKAVTMAWTPLLVEAGR